MFRISKILTPRRVVLKSHIFLLERKKKSKTVKGILRSYDETKSVVLHIV